MKALKSRFKKTTSTRKGRIVASTILVVLLAAIGGGIWYWNSNKKAIIRNELQKAIAKKSQGLYKITYDSLDLDEIAGSLSVSNLTLVYDSIKYVTLQQSDKAPPALINIRIPRINVTGVKTPRALVDKEIVGKKLEIINPVIDIIYTYSGKDSALNTPTREVYEQILGNLDLIQIDSVKVTGAQITTSSMKTGKKILRMEDISLALTDVKVDSISNADTSRLFFAREFGLVCGKLAWSSPDKLYNYSADSISINSISNDLRIRSFRINPTLGEEAFVKAMPTQNDRFDFAINSAHLQNIDLPKLFKENLVADSMLIRSGTFKIYRDLAIPRDRKNRVGLYPHQVMADIPISFSISKLIVSGAFVEYKERSHISRQSGKVQFYNLYAAFNNFTNDKKSISKNNLMTANVSTRLLNKTSLRTNWVFYLGHPKGRFDLKGNLGSIEATQLNPLTVPMGPARIKEGHINSLEFDLKGHDYGMDGTVKMLYDDLKVELLEKDKGSKTLDKKTLMSFLANIVIKNSNPKKNDPPRIAEVHFDRDVNRSIFHLCWKTVFKGISETVGVKK